MITKYDVIVKNTKMQQDTYSVKRKEEAKTSRMHPMGTMAYIGLCKNQSRMYVDIIMKYHIIIKNTKHTIR